MCVFVVKVSMNTLYLRGPFSAPWQTLGSLKRFGVDPKTFPNRPEELAAVFWPFQSRWDLFSFKDAEGGLTRLFKGTGVYVSVLKSKRLSKAS